LVKKLHNRIKHFNDYLAVKGTKIFGSMWLCYLFFLYGFAPLLWPDQETSLLYWSNTIQLWALPLIIVGTNLLDKASERRSQQTYTMVKEELAILRKLVENNNK